LAALWARFHVLLRLPFFDVGSHWRSGLPAVVAVFYASSPFLFCFFFPFLQNIRPLLRKNPPLDLFLPVGSGLLVPCLFIGEFCHLKSRPTSSENRLLAAISLFFLTPVPGDPQIFGPFSSFFSSVFPVSQLTTVLFPTCCMGYHRFGLQGLPFGAPIAFPLVPGLVIGFFCIFDGICGIFRISHIVGCCFGFFSVFLIFFFGGLCTFGGLF